MSKKVVFILSLVAALALAVVLLVGTKLSQFSAMKAAGEKMVLPATTISTFVVAQQVWKTQIRAVGSIEPTQGVNLEAEIPGIVKAINFENGQVVEKGDVLVQLDVSVEQAQLRAAKASANLAKIDFERFQTLRKSGSITQAQLDQASADLERAEAEVDNLSAVIDRKTIRAPFTGRAGIRRVNLGQFVGTGSPIVGLQSDHEVYVNFSLPQQAMSKIETSMQLELSSDVYADQTFSGAITAISPEVDPSTRSIEVQGTLSNKDGLLRSGLFVSVTITLPNPKDVLVVPSTAILYAPYGNSVFVVIPAEGDASPTVKQSFIRIGERKGDFVSIEAGLDLGEEVVSAGTFKLRNNASVKINNDLAPEPELTPTPDNS